MNIDFHSSLCCIKVWLRGSWDVGKKSWGGELGCFNRRDKELVAHAIGGTLKHCDAVRRTCDSRMNP